MGRNYKLIPIPVLAEMFVLVHEGKLDSTAVEKIFIEAAQRINETRVNIKHGDEVEGSILVVRLKSMLNLLQRMDLT